MMDIDQTESDERAPQLRRGTNQSGVRLYNERLVLSLIRQHGALPKANIARLTGLSPPTVQAIVRELEADGLLLRQEAQRGRVGQPSIPLALHPEGAFSFGLKIGRRSAELILMDFVGNVRRALHRTYPYPDPRALVGFVDMGCRTLGKALSEGERSRIAGLGIATPSELWNWEDEVGASPGAMQGWRGFDLQAEVERVTGAPAYLCNDATAACAAELLFGRAADHLDLLYVFVAWFIGGGLVLNGNLFPGRSGYAGSLGQVLVPAGAGPGGQQLLHCASLYVLERSIRAAGGDPSPIWERPDDWSTLEPYLEPWIDQAAEGIAFAVVSSVAVAEFQAAVIDGAFPAEIRSRIVERVRSAIDKLERKGLAPFTVIEGSIGNSARAIGGASLPFLAKFMRDRELLFQAPGDERARGAEPVHLSRPSAF
jgi:predicted NBD/HSP70 family sugar kinase